MTVIAQTEQIAAHSGRQPEPWGHTTPEEERRSGLAVAAYALAAALTGGLVVALMVALVLMRGRIWA